MDALFITSSTQTTLTSQCLIQYQIKSEKKENPNEILLVNLIGKNKENCLIKEGSTHTAIHDVFRKKIGQPFCKNSMASLFYDNRNLIRQKETQQPSTPVSTEHKEKILKALDCFENKNQFKEKGITLYKLSKRINTNSSYLSRVVNNYKEKKFSTYLNDLRINFAVKELKNSKIFRSYSIKHIAFELGYKTRGSFSKAFKQRTGIYPSYYIKQLQSGTT